MRTHRAFTAVLLTFGLGMGGMWVQAGPARAASSAPTVSTGQATGVTQSTATLTGTVDTQGFETVYEFDLGTDTSYGTRIFGDAGAEPGTQAFVFALQGLAPGTTYHYRILATNGFGTVYGADQTFTTGAYPSSILAAPAAPALVPAPVLVVGSGEDAVAATAASAARVARAAKARSATRKRAGRHWRVGGSRASDAHRANGRGKR